MRGQCMQDNIFSFLRKSDTVVWKIVGRGHVPGVSTRFFCPQNYSTICSLYSGIFLGYTIHTEQTFEQMDGE